MKSLFSILVLSLFVIGPVHAKFLGQVTKISSNGQRALMKMGKTITQDQIKAIVVRGPQKKLCRLPVLKTQGNKALVSISKCHFRKSIKVGQKAIVLENPKPEPEFLQEDFMDEEEKVTEKKETSSPLRSIKSLFYMPQKGMVFWDGSFESFGQLNDITNAGGSTSEIKLTSLTLKNRLGYGWKESLSIEATLPYILSDEQSLTTTNSSVTETRGGLSDLEFGFIWRFSENTKVKSHWDFAAYLSPALGDREGHGTTNEGNGFNGRNEARFHLRYATTWVKFTMGLEGSIFYYGEQETTDPDATGTATPTVLEGFMDMQGLIKGRYMWTDNLYLGGALGMEIGGDQSIINSSVEQFGSRIVFGADLGYQFSQEKALLFFEYTYKSGSGDILSSTGTVTGTQDILATVFHLGLRMQF